MVQELAELPGTKNMDDLKSRAQALSQWKISMQRGFLPGADTLDWPVEPFQTSFVNALNNLGMPCFTRRYPKLLDSLLRQMMQLVHVSLFHPSVSRNTCAHRWQAFASFAVSLSCHTITLVRHTAGRSFAYRSARLTQF